MSTVVKTKKLSMPWPTEHRDKPRKLLPPDVAAKTGAWFGRAQSYQIFSTDWYRYRSMALCTGAVLAFVMLVAFALMPVRYRIITAGDLADAVSVMWGYLIPVLLLILVGPALAVRARRSGFNCTD